MKNTITYQLNQIEIEQILALQSHVSIQHAQELHDKKVKLVDQLRSEDRQQPKSTWLNRVVRHVNPKSAQLRTESLDND